MVRKKTKKIIHKRKNKRGQVNLQTNPQEPVQSSGQPIHKSKTRILVISLITLVVIGLLIGLMFFLKPDFIGKAVTFDISLIGDNTVSIPLDENILMKTEAYTNFPVYVKLATNNDGYGFSFNYLVSGNVDVGNLVFPDDINVVNDEDGIITAGVTTWNDAENAPKTLMDLVDENGIVKLMEIPIKANNVAQTSEVISISLSNFEIVDIETNQDIITVDPEVTNFIIGECDAESPCADGACNIDLGVCENDADGDGVSDILDNCPGFADNVDVDADGVPDGCDDIVDSDFDGVADADDECPGFADNVDVDADGIPDGCDDIVDSDFDGVADAADQCPGSDDNVDTDSDGTADGCDACPNDAENDADGDGVCESDEIAGCTDESACNYNDLATDEDGSCTYTDGVCETCEDGLIVDNDQDDDTVCDDDDQCPGFDDNVDEDNNKIPDGCEVEGCTDPEAINHNTNANVDDGSCEYSCLDLSLMPYNNQLKYHSEQNRKDVCESLSCIFSGEDGASNNDFSNYVCSGTPPINTCPDVSKYSVSVNINNDDMGVSLRKDLCESFPGCFYDPGDSEMNTDDTCELSGNPLPSLTILEVSKVAFDGVGELTIEVKFENKGTYEAKDISILAENGVYNVNTAYAGPLNYGQTATMILALQVPLGTLPKSEVTVTLDHNNQIEELDEDDNQLIVNFDDLLLIKGELCNSNNQCEIPICDKGTCGMDFAAGEFTCPVLSQAIDGSVWDEACGSVSGCMVYNNDCISGYDGKIGGPAMMCADFSDFQSSSDLAEAARIKSCISPCTISGNKLTCISPSDDADGDGLVDVLDNCPNDHNPDQENFDNDLEGNVCDLDNDNDGLSDLEEAVKGTSPFNSDSDGDEVQDGSDKCINTPNDKIVVDLGVNFENVKGCPVGDLTADGTVNDNDLTLIDSNFGNKFDTFVDFVKFIHTMRVNWD